MRTSPARARFSDFDLAGDRIPGAVENVASVDLAINHPNGWFGAAALIEDNSVRSEPATLVNLEAGYRLWERYKISAAVYNVLDSDDNDITYYYESQLPNESQPVEDIHFHPVEPRTVRVTLSASSELNRLASAELQVSTEKTPEGSLHSLMSLCRVS